MNTTPPSSAELVGALNQVFGKHRARASHAKGLTFRGYFEPNTNAKQITSATLFQQSKLPLSGRFSVGGGNPEAPDKGKTVRGLALHLGEQLDLVMLSTPVFMVATPEEFVGFLQARRPDPATGKPDPEKVKAFNAATPSTKAQIDYLEQTPVPASYVSTAYWGVNAFRFQSAQGEVHGRWRAEPAAGRVGLTAEQLTKLGDHFLADELKQRLSQSPAVFDLFIQVAEAGDDVVNPTVQWPASRKEVNMGRIVVETLDGGGEQGDIAASVFDPAKLPAGIAMSADPTLLVRSGAYVVSKQQR